MHKADGPLHGGLTPQSAHPKTRRHLGGGGLDLRQHLLDLGRPQDKSCVTVCGLWSAILSLGALAETSAT